MTGRGVFSCVPPRSASTGIAECGSGAVVICHSREERIKVRRVFIIVSFSRRSLFQLVLVMQPAEDLSGRDARISRQLMPTSVWDRPPQPFFRVGGDTGTQGRTRTALVVVGHPLPQSFPQMSLAEWNHVAQTLSAGINGGAGYGAQITSAAANLPSNADLTLTMNGSFGAMDSFLIGNGCSQIVVKDNYTLNQPSSNGAFSGVVPTIAPAASINIGRSHVVLLSSSATAI